MNSATLSQGGRVVVPKPLRETLGVKAGDEVIWLEVDGQIVLTSRQLQVERSQRFLVELMADDQGGSLADELIAGRRAEAAREDAEAEAKTSAAAADNLAFECIRP